MDEDWVEVGQLIEVRRVVSTVVRGYPVALWRTAQGRLVAVDDVCPHQGNPLSTGAVIGETLRCSVHGWEIAPDGWCDRAGAGAGRHDVRVDDGQMWVRLRR